MDESRKKSLSSGRILDVLCEVCGDQSSGRHYGIYACDGCGGFFKRSIRQSRNYECKGVAKCCCVITKTYRNQCRACRLERCIRIGMRKDAVQHERGPRASTLKRKASESKSALGDGKTACLTGDCAENDVHIQSPVKLPETNGETRDTLFYMPNNNWTQLGPQWSKVLEKYLEKDNNPDLATVSQWWLSPGRHVGLGVKRILGAGPEQTAPVYRCTKESTPTPPLLSNHSLPYYTSIEICEVAARTLLQLATYIKTVLPYGANRLRLVRFVEDKWPRLLLIDLSSIRTLGHFNLLVGAAFINISPPTEEKGTDAHYCDQSSAHVSASRVHGILTRLRSCDLTHMEYLEVRKNILSSDDETRSGLHDIEKKRSKNGFRRLRETWRQIATSLNEAKSEDVERVFFLNAIGSSKISNILLDIMLTK